MDQLLVSGGRLVVVDLDLYHLDVRFIVVDVQDSSLRRSSLRIIKVVFVLFVGCVIVDVWLRRLCYVLVMYVRVDKHRLVVPILHGHEWRDNLLTFNDAVS